MYQKIMVIATWIFSRSKTEKPNLRKARVLSLGYSTSEEYELTIYLINFK